MDGLGDLQVEQLSAHSPTVAWEGLGNLQAAECKEDRPMDKLNRFLPAAWMKGLCQSSCDNAFSMTSLEVLTQTWGIRITK